MHITKIRTNVKTGADVEIGPKTLILGPNGAGKSTILHGIELALFGFANDFAGNDTSKQGAEIAMHLAPAGGDGSVFAEAWDSAGRRYFYSKEAGKSPDGSSYPGVATRILPIGEIRAAFGGTNDARKKWLQTVLTVSASDVKRIIRANVADAVAASITDLTVDTDPADPLEALGVVEARCETRIRDVQKATRGAKATVDQLTPQAAGVVTTSDVEALDAKIAEIAPPGQGVSPEIHAEANNRAAALREALVTLTAQQQEAEQQIASLEQVCSANPAPVDTRNPASVERAKLVIAYFQKFASADDAQDCPLCRAHHEPGVISGAARAAIDMARGYLADTVDPFAEHRAALANWRAHLSTVLQQRAEAEGRLRQALATAAAPVVADAAAQQTRAALVAERDRTVQRVALHNQIAVAQKTIAENTAQEAALKLALKAIRDVRDRAVKAALSGFCADVSKFLPRGEAFDIIEDGVHLRMGLRFGVAKDGTGGTFVSALSGAQEAKMLSAVAAAIADQNKDDPSHLSIVIPPERQWSPETLAAFMRTIQKSAAQVIVVSTVKPKGRISDKLWTVIDLSDRPTTPGGGNGGSDDGDDGGDGGDGDDGGDEAAGEDSETDATVSLANGETHTAAYTNETNGTPRAVVRLTSGHAVPFTYTDEPREAEDAWTGPGDDDADEDDFDPGDDVGDNGDDDLSDDDLSDDDPTTWDGDVGMAPAPSSNADLAPLEAV